MAYKEDLAKQNMDSASSNRRLTIVVVCWERANWKWIARRV